MQGASGEAEGGLKVITDDEMREQIRRAWQEQFDRDYSSLLYEFNMYDGERTIKQIMKDWSDRRREMIRRRY